MYTIGSIKTSKWCDGLSEIPQSPETLRYAGTLPSADRPFLAVVGSRKFSSYGKDVCEKIIRELAGTDIVIVSGLALGIDALAHKTALSCGLTTVAFPGSGLSPHVLYPRTNFLLAGEIVDNGGALISEFPNDMRAAPYTFPQRNRLMAGISRGVLIIEATERSGTLITARLATEYNKDVFSVPASIFSKNSEGALRLLKMGAVPVTCGEDILEHWNIERKNAEVQENKNLFVSCTKEEHNLLSYLKDPLSKDELIEKSGLSASEVNVLLSSLEIKECVKESGGKIYPCI